MLMTFFEPLDLARLKIRISTHVVECGGPMWCECQGHQEPHMQLTPQSLSRNRTYLLTADKKIPIDFRSLSKQEPVM